MSKFFFHSFFLFYLCFIVNGCSSSRLFSLHNIPKPNGLYAVGTKQFDWINLDQKDYLGTDSTKNRRIMVQFWYPGEFDNSSDLFFYCDNQIIIDELSREYKIPTKFLSHEGLKGLFILTLIYRS